jgi:hypothetical protein
MVFFILVSQVVFTDSIGYLPMKGDRTREPVPRVRFAI